MTHQFDIEIAERVGVNAAVIYSNIQFWCAKNEANEKNFNDGSYWTYNSVKAWKELFSYLSIDQIRGALKKLEDNELIISGNYNKVGYDRTKWYAIKSQMHLVEIPNGVGRNPEPIPDTKQDTKQYILQSDFSLPKDTLWSKTTEEYKKAVVEHIDSFIAEKRKIAEKNGKYDWVPKIDSEDFILSMESKDYKYKNFIATYKTWLRR